MLDKCLSLISAGSDKMDFLAGIKYVFDTVEKEANNYKENNK